MMHVWVFFFVRACACLAFSHAHTLKWYSSRAFMYVYTCTGHVFMCEIIPDTAV
jgi:hypothetical protein